MIIGSRSRWKSLSISKIQLQKEKSGVKNGWKLVSLRGHRALDGGQFRFWSNLKVPFCVHLWHILVIWDISSHIWWINRQILRSNFSKNGPQKQKKWENGQKQPILGMFWCIWVTKSVSPEFRRSWKVVFCTLFAG